MTAVFETQLRPLWSTIREIREQVGNALGNLPSEVRQATQMVTSELLENAIKYGESVPTFPQIDLNVNVENNQIRVRVMNGSSQREHVDRLMNRVKEISLAPNKEEPYIRRLEQLLDDWTASEKSAGLGIYRIGFEGQFDLECEYESQVLIVTATRGL